MKEDIISHLFSKNVYNFCSDGSGSYPNSFTNVHFWTKTEFSKVVKCTSSWRRPGEGSEE